MSLFNNITNEFYNTINNFGSNPFVLVVLILIILIYYVIFAFLGNSYNEDNYSSSGFVFIEGILWSLVILLVFINGLAYFYNINIVTEIKNIFKEKPEIKIESTLNQNNPLDFKEVYHIPGNNFTYHDAKAICKAFDGDLANYDQLKKEQARGASWCSYGWTQDRLPSHSGLKCSNFVPTLSFWP